MNRILLALNGLLIIAVGYLYVLHFGKSSSEELSLPATIAKNGSSILFINSDSLLDNYEYYKSKKSDLEKRQDQIRGELKAAGDKLQRDVEAYQQRAESLTPGERKQIEEGLMMRQQQLVQQKEAMLGQLDEEQARYSDSLYIRLADFLKDYNKIGRAHV